MCLRSPCCCCRRRQNQQQQQQQLHRPKEIIARYHGVNQIAAISLFFFILHAFSFLPFYNYSICASAYGRERGREKTKEIARGWVKDEKHASSSETLTAKIWNIAFARYVIVYLPFHTHNSILRVHTPSLPHTLSLSFSFSHTRPFTHSFHLRNRYK